jgi:hypothetical protein
MEYYVMHLLRHLSRWEGVSLSSEVTVVDRCRSDSYFRDCIFASGISDTRAPDLKA